MNKITKNIILLLLLSMSIAFVSCEEEDEGGEEEMDIEFKTGPGFVFSDTTLAAGTDVEIGIEAETERAKDPLIRFNISESVDDGAASTVYTEDLDDTRYEYDYDFTLGSTSGETHEFTFTVTNRDGFNAQKSLTITIE
uniref:DUF4625 domain-containing protein n=1 Tax=Roseihalotalea indica TaxID=2867963 RepID=A0AA49GT43_9BACT|nr:hypothetical protein K4G66_06835 [Tunicatimonas sp. TK19036]